MSAPGPSTSSISEVGRNLSAIVRLPRVQTEIRGRHQNRLSHASQRSVPEPAASSLSEVGLGIPVIVRLPPGTCAKPKSALEKAMDNLISLCDAGDPPQQAGAYDSVPSTRTLGGDSSSQVLQGRVVYPTFKSAIPDPCDQIKEKKEMPTTPGAITVAGESRALKRKFEEQSDSKYTNLFARYGKRARLERAALRRKGSQAR